MTLTLVGDGIENPWNARAMQHAAGMFGAGCRFRDCAGLAGAWQAADLAGTPPLLNRDELVGTYRPLIVLDNVAGGARMSTASARRPARTRRWWPEMSAAA
jgi:hypothetical protein